MVTMRRALLYVEEEAKYWRRTEIIYWSSDRTDIFKITRLTYWPESLHGNVEFGCMTIRLSACLHLSKTKSWPTISVKDQRVNILGSAGHMVSVRTIQLGCCSWEVAIDNKSMNECSCVSIKLFLRLLKFEFHIICVTNFCISKILFWVFFSLTI